MTEREIIKALKQARKIKPSEKWGKDTRDFLLRYTYDAHKSEVSESSAPRFSVMGSAKAPLVFVAIASLVVVSAVVVFNSNNDSASQLAAPQIASSGASSFSSVADASRDQIEINVSGQVISINIQRSTTNIQLFAEETLSTENALQIRNALSSYQDTLNSLNQATDEEERTALLAELEQHTQVLDTALQIESNDNTFEYALRLAIEARIANCQDQEILSAANAALEEGTTSGLIEANDYSISCVEEGEGENVEENITEQNPVDQKTGGEES